jgi:pimeloyl-ACP methyl ester carboxylesterase
MTEESLAELSSSSRPLARAVLEELERLTVVSRQHRIRCGCCGEPLTEEEATEEACVHCRGDLTDCQVISSEVFVRDAPRSRDVPWILVLHGMATAGEWQEELSWLCATTYKRSLPVFIYKYGKVRSGVFLQWRQRQLSRQLEQKLRYLNNKYGLGGSGPDVIAHSFGTWLIGRVLMDNPSLRVGRVILAGSVLRPDFDWSLLIGRGQVIAVLNHCALRDEWVPLAQLVIPRAGPSGVHGFLDGSPIHREEQTFGHSTFFRPDQMPRNYEAVWDLFLTRPAERLDELRAGDPITEWRPLPLALRESLRYLLLAIATAIAVVVCLAITVGLAVLAGFYPA